MEVVNMLTMAALSVYLSVFLSICLSVFFFNVCMCARTLILAESSFLYGPSLSISNSRLCRITFRN